MATSHTKIIACATVVEEVLPILPEGISCEVLDFGLHLTPENCVRPYKSALTPRPRMPIP